MKIVDRACTANRGVWGRRLLVAALSSSLGCSFAFVTPPPPRPAPNSEIACTRVAGAPIVDLALFGFGALSTLDTVSAPEGKENTLILTGAVASAALISAIYGFSSVARCNALIKASASRVTAPAPPAPPPAPAPQPLPAISP